ncbi:hypothetical protein ACFW9D_06130, partial [Streptomyces sp. NPDC059524]|uniref:hypothetical protein n=1 Tax=Streptomyces sp. NPDC059524 TaxID=3346856 RepID=UPI003690180B
GAGAGVPRLLSPPDRDTAGPACADRTSRAVPAITGACPAACAAAVSGPAAGPDIDIGAGADAVSGVASP